MTRGRWQWYLTRHRLRAPRFWPLPVTLLGAGLFLSWLFPLIDREVTYYGDELGESFFAHLDSGSMATLLSAVAGGMITLTGLVFTAITLAMQFGASQLSVRVVPLLGQDAVMRWAMGTFMATFVYTLMISVRLAVSQEDYRPVISMFFAILLAVVCAALFFALVGRVTTVLNSGLLLRYLAAEGRKAVDRTHPNGGRTAGPAEDAAAPAPDHAEPVVIRLGTPPRHGQTLIAYDDHGLERVARRTGARIQLVPVVGDFVAQEAPLFLVRPGAGPWVRRDLTRHLLFGTTYSAGTDPAGALRAFVDIALKALSPAVNDPGRAVQCLDHIEDLLVMIAPRIAGRQAAAPTAFRHRTRSWADYVCIATDEIRHFGSASMQVQRRLRALYATAAEVCTPEQVAPLRARLATMDAEVGAQWPQDLDGRLARLPDSQGLGTETGDTRNGPAHRH
ncbi:membrane protein [Streptomyces noursei ZPM]|uniref:DUF2254 domain-containing protein n=1 Tax=Streptomyces noursei TaxID=1971 RepID=A0A401QU45_STRNR|nr:DUF2254 domain-containing protein [Streptomyces noursei]AKA01768.1 membrane protein [Streptomyces noursei ZPM]EPY92832.1 hypothetical protein K530_51215 [Streptomyces noursei CCRC 11814]EXU88997.1 membrane protein [Streptomyces noursei PD-1]UWS70203.1 DUF2254 domain-containing protein [Streptomyces noursei]GCB88895.1 hypothetical protein SALB_01568 [Streptomyces noursei]